MKQHPHLDRETAWDFAAYFDVADELSPNPYGPQLALQDLDPQFLAVAQRAANRLDLPWPPEMTAAEDFALEYGGQISYLHDTTPGTQAGRP